MIEQCPIDCGMYEFCDCKKDGKCSEYEEVNTWDTGGSDQACVIFSLSDTPWERKIEIARFTNEDAALLASKAPYYLGLLKAIRLFGLNDTIKKELDNLD
jgi:hypothetical protein